MKHILSIVLSLMSVLVADAQNDPTIMTINGKPVSRSEFEYSYNKNNTAQTIDKKTVEEYVDMFVNYKLKVEAAKAAKYDTVTAFKKEYATYRDAQARPALIGNNEMEREAHKLYDDARQKVNAGGGMRKVSHILVYLPQKASKNEELAAKKTADSIYTALSNGADFAELAKKCSGDKGSAMNGGELPWIQPGQTVKEFETTAFSLKKGELSKPVLSPYGYHIIKMNDKSDYYPYDSVRSDIFRYMEMRGIRKKLLNEKLDSLVKVEGNGATRETMLQKELAKVEEQNPDLKYLIKEYYEGLLVYNIAKETVWDKASGDVAGQERFFKKNKKRYTWTSPRFKGIYYETKNVADIDKVKKVLKGVDYEKWNDVLKSVFSKDSVLTIKAQKGVFKKGDNALVDNMMFGENREVKKDKMYPYNSVYGKMLKKPKSYVDVQGLVIVDYQDELEKKWVESLRGKYEVTVNKDVLATVNKH